MRKNFSDYIYVKNIDGDMLYAIESADFEDTYIRYDLYLVAGIDYIDPDYSDEQGWVSNSRFVEDAQYDTILQYYIKESLGEAIEDNDYILLGTYDKLTRAMKRVIDSNNQ